MNTFASHSRQSAPRRRGMSAAARRTGFALALGACFLSTHAAFAASATWNVAPADGNWRDFRLRKQLELHRRCDLPRSTSATTNTISNFNNAGTRTPSRSTES